MSMIHTDGETEIGDDDDITLLYTTPPTKSTVLDLENNNTENKDTDELPDFIEEKSTSKTTPSTHSGNKKSTVIPRTP